MCTEKIKTSNLIRGRENCVSLKPNRHTDRHMDIRMDISIYRVALLQKREETRDAIHLWNTNWVENNMLMVFMQEILIYIQYTDEL